MILFAHPAYLWLLLLVPLFPVVYGIARYLRRRRLRRFGDEVCQKPVPKNEKIKIAISPYPV